MSDRRERAVSGVFDRCHPTEAWELTQVAPVTSRILAAIVMTTALASPSPHARVQSPVTTVSPALHDLRGVAEFRSLFESDRDKIRIVLLLSPT